MADELDQTKPPEAHLEDILKALKERSAAPEEAEPVASPQTQRDVWLEVGVVSMVTFFPHFSLGLWDWLWPDSLSGTTPSSLHTSLSGIRIVLPECVFLLYMMWRSGEPWSHFGLKPIRWRQDAFLVLATSFLRYWTLKLVTVVLWYFLGKKSLGTGGAGLSSSLKDPTCVVEYVALVFCVFVNAFDEEILFRGYLIPRLERLLGSVWLSLLISSVIFASGHFPTGFFFVRYTVVGLIYGGVFCFTRRLWPIVVTHAAYNLWLDLR